MGIKNCGPAGSISTQEKYFFTQNQIDISGNQKDDMKEVAKLEVKITNISSGNCSVSLVLYSDSQRRNRIPGGGNTERGGCDSSTNSISFNQFFTVNYYFEREQPIDFIVSGSINGTVKTTLPSIMGSRGQTLKRPIEGGNGAYLEVRGFAFKNKQTASLYFNVSLNGRFSERGILYTIK